MIAPLTHAERSHLLSDTHAHLDAPEFGGDLDAVLARARTAGIDRILAVGSDFATSLTAVEIAHAYDIVYAAVGMHPHEAHHFPMEEARLRALLDEEKVVAVGEIGLDYHRDTIPRGAQLVAFRSQLAWARARDLPVSVHNRDADDDVLVEMARAGVRGVLHCFSGSIALARRAVEAGLHLSFAGNVTYPKADDLREVAAKVPLDRLLLETDSPVLAPQSRRGRRNEPAYIVSTWEAVAATRGVSADVLAHAVSENANSIFSWRTT